MPKLKRIAYFAFLAIEVVIYILILFVHFSDPYAANVVRFSTVAIAFLFAWFFLEKKPLFVICAGMTFTLIADFLLECVVPQQQSWAVTSFLLVQFLYCTYICSHAKMMENIIHLSIRMVISIAAGIIVMLVLKEKADYLSIVSLLYFANLLLNVVFAFIHFKKHPLFAIGLLLFALCDISVGLFIGVKEGYIELPNGLLTDILFYPFDWAWMFYVPSQVLIVSEICFQQKKLR